MYVRKKVKNRKLLGSTNIYIFRLRLNLDPSLTCDISINSTSEIVGHLAHYHCHTQLSWVLSY